MARSTPTLIYFKRDDRKRLEAVAMTRGLSLSLCVVGLVRDAFAAAFGGSADPGATLERHRKVFENQPTVTQRMRRGRRAARGISNGGKDVADLLG